MNVIARRTLVAYWTAHPTSEAPLSSWFRIAQGAEWRSFSDVRGTFNSADHVGNNKVVFNVGGNNYRLVALIGYRAQRLFILWVGTHAQYDRIDVTTL